MTFGRFLLFVWMGLVLGEILRGLLRAASRLLSPAPPPPSPTSDGWDPVEGGGELAPLDGRTSLAWTCTNIDWCKEEIRALWQDAINAGEASALAEAFAHLSIALQAGRRAQEAVQQGPDEPQPH